MNKKMTILTTLFFAIAITTSAASDLERRLREQERQIEQLETENSRLWWLLQSKRHGTLGDVTLSTSANGTEKTAISKPKVDSPMTQKPRSQNSPPAAKPLLPSSNFHIVQAGENLYRIALRYGTPLQSILDANPGIDPRSLRIGQKVTVKPSRPRTDSTIANRDTLTSR